MKRAMSQIERDELKRAKIAREALRKESEALIRELHGFLDGEATKGLITPMKMHLQIHTVTLAAVLERAVSRLKRPMRESAGGMTTS